MRILYSLLALTSAKITVIPKEQKLIRGAGRSLILTCQGAKNLEWIGPDGRLIDNSDRSVSPYVQRTRSSLKLRISPDGIEKGFRDYLVKYDFPTANECAPYNTKIEQ